MSEEIGYEEGVPEKPVPPLVADAEEKEMREKAIRQIEQQQANKQAQVEAGIEKAPPPAESIPKELPKIMFKLGSKIIACDKFQLDDEEARIMAKHMSVIIGSINSKMYSAIIIVIVVISKVSECISAIKQRFTGKKEDQASTEAPKTYQGQPVYGDGTSGTK